MTEQPIRSIWYDVQAEQGGSFDDFWGWLWTGTFGDVPGEYEAIRSGAGMWDVYPLVKWEFRGSDALAAVQKVFTNDVLGLADGQGRYGALVGDRGVMVDDGTVYRLAFDRCWLMTNSAEHAEWFGDVSGGMDVEFADRTHEMPLLSVQGPRSRDLLGEITGTDLSELGYFRFWPEKVPVAGVPCWVLRTGFSGELGFELIPERDRAVELWKAVQGAGVAPFGTHGVEIARIESGMIVYGFDYEAGARTPYDLSFDRFVKLDAGFVGAEALREIAANPPNRLVTLRLEARDVPEYGATVTKDGEEIGVLTSPADSPRFGVIGLAILRTDEAVVGNSVDVALGDGTVGAIVDILSLYDPEKKRPRS